MRLSTLIGKTLRQPPSDAHLVSHQLLARAGLIRSLEGGAFAFLPLGCQTIERLQSMTRKRLRALPGQQMVIPKRPDHSTSEDVVHLARKEIDSYRQLPVVLFSMGNRLMTESGSRAGLFGASQRLIAEIHAFGDSHLETVQQETLSVMEEILTTCSLEWIWATEHESDQTAVYIHPQGDQEIAHCSNCGYAAHRSWAQTSWPDAPQETELPLEEIDTPGCNTIATLAEFLGIPAANTLKMVFYSVEGKVTCLVIRGDRSVDEAKLARLLDTDWYYASLEDELEAVGAVGGYASPIGLDPRQIHVIADPSIRSGKNFVSGANQPDVHLKNINVPRDFSPSKWADLAQIEPGDACPQCGGCLEIVAGFSLACITAPGPCQPEAEYLDAAGRGQPLWTCTGTLDLARLLAAVVETNHDEHGILWPLDCTPIDVHLVALDMRKEDVAAQADALYERLQSDGLSVLYDDRNASAGVKFNDADLIGIPLRLTISKRSVKEGVVEAKWRDKPDRLKLDTPSLHSELAKLHKP